MTEEELQQNPTPGSKQDGRKTRWLNATEEQRKAHGEKIRAGRAAAKASRIVIVTGDEEVVAGPVPEDGSNQAQ